MSERARERESSAPPSACCVITIQEQIKLLHLHFNALEIPLAQNSFNPPILQGVVGEHLFISPPFGVTGKNIIPQKDS